MENESPKPDKKRFYEVCQLYNLDYQAMQAIADKAGVPKNVVDSMSVSIAIPRVHAAAILAALSEHTEQPWSLDTVKVVLQPTFQDLHALHQFDLAILSTASGVSFDIVGMLLKNEPVPKREARFILKAASMQTGQEYTLDNVDVKLT